MVRKTFAAIFKVLSFGVYILIVAALLLVAPIVAGYKPVVVLSPSMEPAYPVGSIIYYKSTPFSEIQVGDAITFELGDSIATHRVISVNTEDQSFMTKGDNNPTEDPNPVLYSRVRGKSAPFAVPFAGYAISYVRNWFLVAALAAILLLNALLAPDEKKNKKDKKKEKNKPAPAQGPAGAQDKEDISAENSAEKEAQAQGEVLAEETVPGEMFEPVHTVSGGSRPPAAASGESHPQTSTGAILYRPPHGSIGVDAYKSVSSTPKRSAGAYPTGSAPVPSPPAKDYFAQDAAYSPKTAPPAGLTRGYTPMRSAPSGRPRSTVNQPQKSTEASSYRNSSNFPPENTGPYPYKDAFGSYGKSTGAYPQRNVPVPTPTTAASVPAGEKNAQMDTD